MKATTTQKSIVVWQWGLLIALLNVVISFAAYAVFVYEWNSLVINLLTIAKPIINYWDYFWQFAILWLAAVVLFANK